MTANQIAQAIEDRIQSSKPPNYAVWTVGVTDDPSRRFAEHGSPKFWLHWPADSEQVARDVEAHFVAKGMKGGPGGQGNAAYVYIF